MKHAQILHVKEQTPNKAITQGRQNHFNYTAIVDRVKIMTISLSGYRHPTCMVNQFTDPTFHPPQQLCDQKDIYSKSVPYLPLRDRGTTVIQSGWVIKSSNHASQVIQCITTPGIRPNASGAATVSPDGKQVGKNFITNLIIIIKVCYLLYIL